MPYSDPEKKKAYMAKYNPKYYSENREPLIKKNTSRKKDLRERKREHILSRFENSCPHCGNMAIHPIKLYIEYRMEEPPIKSVFVPPVSIVENLPTISGLEATIIGFWDFEKYQIPTFR